MDRATVLEQLTEVAVDVLGADPAVVSESARFKEDLDADSLDLVEVVMALEERFSISVPEDKLDGITTVGEAIDLVIGIAEAGEATEPVEAATPAETAAPAETAMSAETPDAADGAASAGAAAPAETPEPAEISNPA